jgi:hypothetical protein
VLGKPVKVKVTLYRPPRAYSGSRGLSLLFHDLGARVGGCSAPHPIRFIAGKDRYPLYFGLDGPQVFYKMNLRSPDSPARSSVAIPSKVPDPARETGTFIYLFIYTFLLLLKCTDTANNLRA